MLKPSDIDESSVVLEPSSVDFRVIGILGADHSCSTLLGCILGSTKQFGDIFHVGECHAYFRAVRERYGPRCVMENPCPIWSDIHRQDGGITAYKQIAERVKCRVIVDSSKTVPWFSVQHKICKSNNWPIDYMIVWKPPIDLAYSYWKRESRIGPVSYERTKLQMRRLEKILKFEKEMGKKFPVVSGRALVKSPEETLQKICRKVDVPYFAGKEKYWEFEHHHLYGGIMQRKHINQPEKAGYVTKERNKEFPTEKYQPLCDQYSDLVAELEQRSI